MALPVSRLVRVAVNLSPIAAARRSFGILCVAGDSDVINGLERIRSYDSYDGVAEDFGVDAPESIGAAAYFGQTPKPRTIMIGRWLRTATAGQNVGGILTAAQQVIANWQVISSGGVNFTIDGSAQNLTALDFTGVTNLNGVASVIQASLTGGATCVWDGQKFIVSSGTTGAGVKATGYIELAGQPDPNDTVTVNGQAFTFVASAPTTNQVLIGADATATAANLAAKLQTSVVVGVAAATYTFVPADDRVSIEYKTVGTGGNAFTLAKSGANITISGGTLTGGAVASSVGYATAGAGTDISALLKMTSSTAISLVPGYDAETPVEAAAALAQKSTAWYGLAFQASVQPTDDQSIDVSAFIEALDIKRIYGVTITDPNVLSALVTNDLASRQKDAGYLRSFCQYSQQVQAICSFIGRAFAVNFNANRSTITMMYKQEPGINGEELTTTEANTLESKRCNVFVNYINDTKIIQYGVMSGPAWFDEIHGLDWLQDAIQNACYNLLYTSPTKIPQTDAGANQFVNAINGVCDEAVNNGLVAPGTWTSTVEFGQLSTGQYLKNGYYTYATPMALQSQADREARVAPPIQTAIKLAGAIQELDVVIDVNR